MATFGEKKRLGLFMTVLLIVLVAAFMIGFRIAATTLKGKVEQALGPDSEVRALNLGWTGVTVEGLRIRGDRQWPTEDTLRAERVHIAPSLLSLFSGRYRIRSMTIDRPYVSVYKTRNGNVLVVPGLLRGDEGRQKPEDSRERLEIAIGRISLKDGEFEFFDASVATPPQKIRLEQLKAGIEDLKIPAGAGRSSFTLSGVVKGANTDGQVNVSGWAEIATRDSSVTMHLRSVDLVTLQPYISRAGDTKVRRGTFDLDVRSDVREKRLKAPGTFVISDLEFGPSKGMFGTFLGVPREMVLTFLKDRNNRISLDFTLEGDIDNPRFSLRRAFSDRLAVSLAETLGVSIKGLAEGAGSLGQKSIDAAGEVVKGVGEAIEQILGGKKK